MSQKYLIESAIYNNNFRSGFCHKTRKVSWKEMKKPLIWFPSPEIFLSDSAQKREKTYETHEKRDFNAFLVIWSYFLLEKKHYNAVLEVVKLVTG